MRRSEPKHGLSKAAGLARSRVAPGRLTRRRCLKRGLALWLGLGGVAAAVAESSGISPLRVLALPRDHGAHPGARIEWWYATGWLQQGPDVAPGASSGACLFGFQLTFFRSAPAWSTTCPATSYRANCCLPIPR